MDAKEGGTAGTNGNSCENFGSASRILNLYGIRIFIEDIERRREFWRDGGGLVAAALDWLSTEGFAEFMIEADLDYASAEEFRQRHITRLLKALAGG